MARSYLPSKVSEIVAIWRNDLSKVISLSSAFMLFLGTVHLLNNVCYYLILVIYSFYARLIQKLLSL
jgi:hypothetical protein